MLRNKVTDIVSCRVAEVRPGPVSADLEITFDDGRALWKSWLPALRACGRNP